MAPSNLVTTFAALLASGLSAGGGIGGGGLFVPLYILVAHYQPRHAVALSTATIFGGMIVNLCMNLPKRHPFLDRPLIDFTAAFILEPSALVGTVLGVLLNRILPTLVTSLLLVPSHVHPTPRGLRQRGGRGLCFPPHSSENQCCRYVWLARRQYPHIAAPPQ